MIKYVVLAIFLVLKFFTLDNCFFWDNVAGYSIPASYLLEYGFLQFIYPPELVSEPPLAHIYLAMLWSLFGKSLLVAHLSITPFSVGIIWQVYRLCKKLNTKYTPYIFLLVLLEPALSTQLILISPDIIMCFFALWSINLLLENKRGWLALSTLCLGMISIRGFVVSAGLGLGYWLIVKVFGQKSFKAAFFYVFPAFVPVLLAMGIWFLYRKLETGYFMYQPGFAYMQHRELASLNQVIKNILSLAMGMLDSGRIIIWIFLFITILKMGIKNFIHYISSSPLCFIYLSILFTISLVTIPVTNPFGNRYFIILYILLTLITSQLLLQVYKTKKMQIIFIGMLLVLFSGNFWVYSEKKSKSWDSILCHLPFYSMRQEMIIYLENHNINISDVSASFPLSASFSDLDINEDKRQFSTVDWDKSKYILYSNLYNWNDESIDTIHTKWKLQKELKRGLIFLRLYVPLDKK
jgi:hypothetical protein